MTSTITPQIKTILDKYEATSSASSAAPASW